MLCFVCFPDTSLVSFSLKSLLLTALEVNPQNTRGNLFLCLFVCLPVLSFVLSLNSSLFRDTYIFIPNYPRTFCIFVCLFVYLAVPCSPSPLLLRILHCCCWRWSPFSQSGRWSRHPALSLPARHCSAFDSPVQKETDADQLMVSILSIRDTEAKVT